MAVCVYHEARGEPEEGKIAVCHVIMNRVIKRGKSIKEVVLQPYQFSWANGGARPAINDYDSLEQCYQACIKCFDERAEGKTLERADHYFADYIKTPSWAKNMKKIKKIGRHVFFRE